MLTFVHEREQLSLLQPQDEDGGPLLVRVRVRERLRATPGHVIGQGPAPGGRVVPRWGAGSGGRGSGGGGD